ncbi:unnamed protein product, partial [Ectocarpus sp. 12 AP-2014]
GVCSWTRGKHQTGSAAVPPRQGNNCARPHCEDESAKGSLGGRTGGVGTHHKGWQDQTGDQGETRKKVKKIARLRAAEGSLSSKTLRSWLVRTCSSRTP